MIQLFTLLAAGAALGFIYTNQKRATDSLYLAEGHSKLKKHNTFELNLLCIAIVLLLGLYCGMRTSYNDTWAYTRAFRLMTTDFGAVNWGEVENPGFVFYQIAIKRIFNGNPQWFLLITALITVSCQVHFIRRYSLNFGAAIFWYITAGIYSFIFGAMKQALATALLVFAIDFVKSKKWFWYYVVWLIALSIHAYAFMFVITPLFVKKCWSKRTYMILIGMLGIGTFFGSFLKVLLSVLGEMNDFYTMETLSGTGVNIFRVAVFGVPVALSWYYRLQIQQEDDRVLNLCVNYGVISFAFMFISLFGNPILFGRVANYFQPFTIVSTTYCIFNCVSKRNRTLVTLAMLACYLFFYYMTFSVYVRAGHDDFFNHAPFTSLF